MKVAISAEAPNLDAQVDPRFGRCSYFVIVDPETMSFEAIENSSSGAAGGAGIATGQLIASKGVEVVLTGNCGPNAYQTLTAAGIKIITGATGRVRDALEQYRTGQSEGISQPNVGLHAGTGSGMGRGMGGGRGMGMGGGRGIGIVPPPPADPPQMVSREQEVAMLKEQARVLSQQLEEIQRHIGKLE